VARVRDARDTGSVVGLPFGFGVSRRTFGLVVSVFAFRRGMAQAAAILTAAA
jgi:hypothetical protein